MKIKQPKSKYRGFSLIELLMVIGVVGVIGGIAIPALAGVGESSKQAVAQNQAQNIASVFGGGISMGSPEFGAATGVDSAMDAVGAGGHGGGDNVAETFHLPGISATMDNGKPLEQQAKHYLGWDAGRLVYYDDGAPEVPSAPSTPPEDLNGPPPGTGWINGGTWPDANAANAFIADHESRYPQYEYRLKGLIIWWRTR